MRVVPAKPASRCFDPAPVSACQDFYGKLFRNSLDGGCLVRVGVACPSRPLGAGAAGWGYLRTQQSGLRVWAAVRTSTRAERVASDCPQWTVQACARQCRNADARRRTSGSSVWQKRTSSMQPNRSARFRTYFRVGNCGGRSHRGGWSPAKTRPFRPRPSAGFQPGERPQGRRSADVVPLCDAQPPADRRGPDRPGRQGDELTPAV